MKGAKMGLSKGMCKIAEILMKRDGISKNEAEEIVSEAREAIMDCGGDYEEAENVMYGDLGLEMDYLMDLLS